MLRFIWIASVIFAVAALTGCPDEAAPKAGCIGLPLKGKAPLAVQFTDLSVVGGRGISSWWWDFGDEAKSSVQHPKHTFLVAGTYSVTLKVATPGGESSATTVVEVLPADTENEDLHAAGFSQNFLGMEFAWIPKGEFDMGIDDKPDSDEYPRHHVKITQGFWMGKAEVTQAQWKMVMGGLNPSSFQVDTQPVEQVSWDDCQVFLEKLNRMSNGGQFRLPTEAEWEYAARSGGTGSYFFGSSSAGLGHFAWYSQNAQNVTHPVKQKFPNGYGLYDILGNAAEWCQDLYHADYYIVSPEEDPLGPSDANYRVVRGGSWSEFADNSACTTRFGVYPSTRLNTVGLRLVKEETNSAVSPTAPSTPAGGGTSGGGTTGNSDSDS